MKNSGKTHGGKKIVVKIRDSWSSSYSRMMSTAGKAASADAIQKALSHGTRISYLENGVVIKADPAEMAVRIKKA